MSQPYRPMYCPVCKQKNEYYGRLVFEAEFDAVDASNGTDPDPMCPNHKTPLPLVNAVPPRNRTATFKGHVGP